MGHKPVPRPMPSPVGFTLPFKTLQLSVHHFAELLREAKELLASLPKDEPAGLHLSPAQLATTWHWQTYAWAVQVFAAMSAEAALNTYGMMRFGPEVFEKHYRYGNPVVRLKKLVRDGTGVRLSRNHDLVRLLGSLTAKRDELVHMQADQDLLDASGRMVSFRGPPPDPWAGADAALREMEEFLRGFSRLDPDMVLTLMPYLMPTREADIE